MFLDYCEKCGKLFKSRSIIFLSIKIISHKSTHQKIK